VDAFFWGSVLFKVPNGGWVAILISLFFIFTMLSWVYGESELDHAFRKIYNVNYTTVEELAGNLSQNIVKVKGTDLDESASKSSKSGGSANSGKTLDSKKEKDDESYTPIIDLNIANNTVPAVRVPGIGVFLSHSTKYVPQSFDMFVEKTHGIPQFLIFMKIIKKFTPRVKAKKRFTLKKHPGNIYTLEVNVGFAEYDFNVENLINDISDSFSENPLTVTYYKTKQVIKVSTKNQIKKFVLNYYGYLKDISNNGSEGAKLPVSSIIYISFLCQLH